MFSLDELIQQSNKCTGCGFCLETCPIYETLAVETLASRGRVDTILGAIKGDLKLTPRMEEILSTCLLCMACEFACPSGVPVQKLILEGRHWAVQTRGLPILKRLVLRRLLKDRQALRFALSVAKAFTRRRSRKASSPPLRHLPALLSGIAGGRALPPLADRPLRQRVPERIQPWPNVEYRGRVGLFVGCYLEFADTPIAEAGIRMITSRGHEVLYPKGQVCCGAPALFTGDLENAVQLARMNAEAFNESAVETVVTLCATCASALREGYQMFKDHLAQEDQERVLSLSCRVQDISQWLNEHGPPHGLDREVNLTLTYHDPCHHVRALGVQEQPRNLLREIAGVRLVEMARPAHCCGGGGSFSFSHPDVSLQVGRAKVDDILATGAQALVTACPGCILQIQDVAQRENASFEVLHLVEVLERALARTTEP